MNAMVGRRSSMDIFFSSYPALDCARLSQWQVKRQTVFQSKTIFTSSTQEDSNLKLELPDYWYRYNINTTQLACKSPTHQSSTNFNIDTVQEEATNHWNNINMSAQNTAGNDHSIIALALSTLPVHTTRTVPYRHRHFPWKKEKE